MNEPERPKFGLLETLRVILSGDFLRSLSKNEPRMTGKIGAWRDAIQSTLLLKRLPFRNADGTMNWANFFAWNCGVIQPVTRKDVFPEGDEEIVPSRIAGLVEDYLNQRSTHPDRGYIFDPNEFPEVIDEDFRNLAAKINQLNFIRTIMSCSGHADKANGYMDSFMEFAVDPDYPNTALFHEQLRGLTVRFQSEHVKVVVTAPETVQPVVKNFFVNLTLLPPPDWTEEAESPKSDEITYLEIQEGLYFLRVVHPGDEDYLNKRNNQALMANHRRMKAWGQSSRCKEIILLRN